VRLRKIATMKMTHPTYMTLVVATHRDNDDPVEPAIITGFGMLEIRKRGVNDWSFALNASVADTVGDEARLLTQLADALPMPKFLIGEAIRARIVTPVEAGADRATPIVAAHIRHRIARLQTAISVDLFLGNARPAAPLPYAEPVQLCPPVSITVVDGKIADPKQARADLEARAVSDWMRFLTGSGSRVVGTASIAMMTWMAAKGFR
jgi:hypothetical protein